MIKIIVWYCLNRGNLASPNVSSQLTPLVAFVTNVLPTPQSPQQMQFHWNWHHHHCHQLWRIEIYWCIMVICLNTVWICFVVNCRCRSWAGWASQIKTNKECETRWNFRFHKFKAVLFLSFHFHKISIACIFFYVFKGFQLICNLPFFGSCFIHLGINFLNLPPPPAACEFKLLFIQTPKLSHQTKQRKPMLCLL